MSWLLSTLSKEVLNAVVGARSSLEVWQILVAQFGARSRARVLHLRTQIQTTRKGSTSIHEYYTKMKTTLDALRAAGNNMTDEDFVLCLLAGLGSEYDSIVTTINAQPEGTSPSDVYGMLLSHEHRIEYQHSVSHMDYQANLAYHRGIQRRNWQPNNNYSGRPAGSSNGKQPGGYSFNQNMNSSDKFKGKNSADEEEPKGPCQICFRKNHTATSYWYKFKKNYVPNQAPNRRSAYIAENGGHRDGAWYLDSGATNHISNDFNNLNISSEYKGSDQLAVGNGTKLKIVSVGHSLLSTLDLHTSTHIKLNHILYVPEITKNLISISQLLHDNDVSIEFHKTCCVVKDKRRGSVLLKGVAKDGLYKLLSLPHDSSQFKSILLSSITTPSLLTVNKTTCPESMLSVSCNENYTSNKVLDLWHMRLGHPSVSALVKTLSACNIQFGNKTSGLSFCKAC